MATSLRTARLLAVLVLVAACVDVLNDARVGGVKSVLVSPDSSDLVIGTQARLRAFPLDQSGALRPGFGTTWSSLDPQVATVDDTGGITGVGNGVATIMATAAGVEGMARVRVGPRPTISLSPAMVTFDAQAGQVSPAPQNVTVTNTGGLSLSGLTVGVITYGAGAQNWLSAQLNQTTAPATLTLTPATSAITVVGTYTASVPVQAAAASNTPQTVAVTLNVAPGPPTTHVITVFAGDGQEAASGAALAMDPAVQVTDSFGNPIMGELVTFQVTGGGGMITGPTALTDAGGVATVGSWAVGAAGAVPADGRFLNTLQASTPTAGAVSFTARAFFTYAAHVHAMWANYSCTGCHGGLGGLTLTGAAATVYTTELYNVPATCGSGSILEVSPDSGALAEANSLLMLKLDNLSPAACPGGMPSSTTLLSPAVRDTIRAWIRAGAPLN